MLGIRPEVLVRKGEDVYKAKYAGKTLSDDLWIAGDDRGSHPDRAPDRRRRRFGGDWPTAGERTTAARPVNAFDVARAAEPCTRLLRRVPLQPSRARAGLDHEPRAQPRARRADAPRRRAAGRGRLGRRADRRRRGRGDPAPPPRLATPSTAHALAARRGRGPVASPRSRARSAASRSASRCCARSSASAST